MSKSFEIFMSLKNFAIQISFLHFKFTLEVFFEVINLFIQVDFFGEFLLLDPKSLPKGLPTGLLVSYYHTYLLSTFAIGIKLLWRCQL